MSIVQKIKAINSAQRRRAQFKGALRDFTNGIADHLPPEQRYNLEELALVYGEIAEKANGTPVRFREKTNGSVEFWTTNCILICPAKQSQPAP